VLGLSHPAFYASGLIAWVEEIVVREDLRRMGIGQELMNSFEAWAVLKECRLIALATRRAADFYKRIGYAESAIYFKKTLVLPAP
jgi:GNAT superfamily N-acetyltransferase